jgi:hypothetical protein
MSAREQILTLQERMAQSIIGQSQVVKRLLLTLLCNGNLLLEGLPGLAKTRAIKSLVANLEAEFRRIQFTPDQPPCRPQPAAAGGGAPGVLPEPRNVLARHSTGACLATGTPATPGTADYR